MRKLIIISATILIGILGIGLISMSKSRLSDQTSPQLTQPIPTAQPTVTPITSPSPTSSPNVTMRPTTTPTASPFQTPDDRRRGADKPED